MAPQFTKSLFPVNRVTDPSIDFVKALQEDSNMEVDWLFWASKLTSRDEQLYCLERALYIHPNSREAADALRQLSQTTQSAHRPALVARRRWVTFGKSEA
ncbi:MAG: hypothetical protein IPO91_02080 [Chloroflexi bacterium]|nr:hypothetical protein [Chloroflexota bacterium]